MKSRMNALRAEMAVHSDHRGPQINAYIVTPFDEHQTYQTDDTESQLQYISGYSGPTGYAVVSFKLELATNIEDAKLLFSFYRFRQVLPRSGSMRSILSRLTVSSTASGKSSLCPRSLQSLCG
jgi:hypothetical protein